MIIDSLRIQQELKDVKLTSMTQVINFVVEQVYKMMSYDPIQQLSFRVSELEKPKGLDQIMIEQVKTLIEAMLQQKQQQLRKDLQRTIHHNVEYMMEQQNTRRSMKQLDVLQLINTGSESRKSSINSITKPETHNCSLQLIKRQIQQLHRSIQKKPDRRQVNQKILDIQKQVSSKMPVNQAERIVQKFQKQVFLKLNQNNLILHKMQFNIKKNLLDDLHQFKKDFTENNKIRQLKSSFSKVQKKMKRNQTQIQQFTHRIHQQTAQVKNQMRESVEQLCVVFQSLNQIKQQNDSKKIFPIALWKAEHQYNLNNMAICWSVEISNDDQQLYKFQSKKSQIMINQAGYYRAEIIVTGCEKAPSVYIGSQPKYKLQHKLSHKLGSPTFTLVQLINIAKQQTLISVRLESNNNYQNALIRLSKID